MGLDSPLKAYPSAVPVRDRGQLGVIARLEPLVARPLTVAREVGLPEVRDDPGTAVVILVVARSAHNRRVLAEHREALRQQFPLDGAAIARSLRHGLVPRESGIIAF